MLSFRAWIVSVCGAAVCAAAARVAPEPQDATTMSAMTAQPFETANGFMTVSLTGMSGRCAANHRDLRERETNHAGVVSPSPRCPLWFKLFDCALVRSYQ